MNKKFAYAALSLLPFSAMAEEAKQEEDKSPFVSSAELGALIKTGNSKSGDLKTALSTTYEKDKWKAVVKFDLLAKKAEVENDDGDDEYETTDQKWQLAGQVNYTVDKSNPNYIYGSGLYIDDRFNGFKYQSSVSAGWGRQWYKTEVASLDLDIGPGFKRDEFEATDTEGEYSENSLIVQTQALYKRKINDNVDFKLFFRGQTATESDKNSYYESEASVTSQLIGALQLKVAFKVEHNTEVEEDKDNTDTQTAITLIYNF